MKFVNFSVLEEMWNSFEEEITNLIVFDTEILNPAAIETVHAVKMDHSSNLKKKKDV